MFHLLNTIQSLFWTENYVGLHRFLCCAFFYNIKCPYTHEVIYFYKIFVKQRDIFTLQMRNWDIETSRLNLTWHAYIWIYFWMQSPWAAIYFNCIWSAQHMWKSLSTCLTKDMEKMSAPENGLRKFSSTKHEVCISMEAENATQSCLVTIPGFLLQHRFLFQQPTVSPELKGEGCSLYYP